MARGLLALAKNGWSPRYDPLSGGDVHYLAGPDAERAAQLADAACGSDAIWAVRGGYGTLRTLDALGPRRRALADAVGEAGLPVVGFSDMTALLNWLAQTAGVQTIHGPVVTQFGELEPAAADHLVALLEGRARPLPTTHAVVRRAGDAEGPVFGGNLSVLASLIGTPWMPNLDGSFVLLEDTGEPTYRLDRALTQLRLSGALDGIIGFLFGHFSGVSPGDRSALDALLTEAAGWADGPSVSALPIGHEPDNHAVALGAWVRVVASEVGARIEPIVTRP